MYLHGSLGESPVTYNVTDIEEPQPSEDGSAKLNELLAVLSLLAFVWNAFKK